TIRMPQYCPIGPAPGRAAEHRGPSWRWRLGDSLAELATGLLGTPLAQPWLTLRRCQPKMTAGATAPPPTPHPDREPPAAGPAGGGGCCTRGGAPPRREPAARPPPTSQSRGGRPPRPGPAPPPSPSRP